jgi:hypothetical protein
MPAVTITLPEGSTHSSEDGDVEKALSGALGCDVRLETAAPEEPSLEKYWPHRSPDV